jgi:hypothetical protein
LKKFRVFCHKTTRTFPTQSKRDKGVFKMTNTQLVNQVAMEIQSIENKELRSLCSNQLFELMEGWIVRQSNKIYPSMKMYHGELEEIRGRIEDGILRWVLEQDGHEPFDSSKGNFYGYIRGHVRNELKKYKSKLTADQRNISHEKFSLNDEPQALNGNSFSDVISNTYEQPLETSSSFDMDIHTAISEFSITVKNGEMKASVVTKLINSHMFDNQDVAEAMGFDSYTNTARQKAKRIKKEFAEFLSQNGF